MTKKQEQAAEAATTPEITGETEAKIEHKTPCVYCGPSVRGVARQYTVYASRQHPGGAGRVCEAAPGGQEPACAGGTLCTDAQGTGNGRNGGKHFVQQDQKRTVRRNNRYGYIQTWRIYQRTGHQYDRPRDRHRRFARWLWAPRP